MIAITGLLDAPVRLGMMVRAQDAKWVSNLGQIGTAVASYVHEHDRAVNDN